MATPSPLSINSLHQVGRVTVVAHRTASIAEISVTDTGEGIELEFLPYVFDRFQQADTSVTRKPGGLSRIGFGGEINTHCLRFHESTVGLVLPSTARVRRDM